MYCLNTQDLASRYFYSAVRIGYLNPVGKVNCIWLQFEL